MDEDFDPRNSRRPDSSGRPQPKPVKGVFILFLILLIVTFALVYGQKGLGGKVKTLEVAEFMDLLKKHQIKTIIMEGNEVKGEFVDGGEYKKYDCILPDGFARDPDKIDLMMKRLPDPKDFHYESPNVFLYQVLIPLIPWVVLFLLAWWFLFRQVKATTGPGGIFAFGRSRAKLAGKDQKKITFKNVAGIEEAKEEVGEIIEFLRNPSKFQRLGGRIPRGVLLVGPPGTGKTLLAKAIAGEADVPFMSISGSDFVEMFVGVGASRVRDLFRQAKENSPCIIFLDEIDAVGRRRGTGLGGGHDEREQTLNAILVEMDGFDTDTGVIVMAATNRPDILDPALLRPGRFDREIVIDMPDVKGREEILKVHAANVKMAPEVDLKVLARTTPMFSGADLEAVINEAALRAVMKKKEAVDKEDLEEARDRVRWGRQKRSKVMEEEDRKITAYHESGHALVTSLIPGLDPIHKVTIIPRGPALGATMRMPEKDRYHMARRYALGMITVLFAGRAAEEVFCVDISAGARNDIKEATELARMMVCEWGMSEKMGPVSYSETEEHIFLGREISRTRNHSEHIAEEIDAEVRKIIDEGYRRAQEIVRENRDVCDRIANALLRYEVLDRDDIDRLMKGAGVDELKDKHNGNS